MPGAPENLGRSILKPGTEGAPGSAVSDMMETRQVKEREREGERKREKRISDYRPITCRDVVCVCVCDRELDFVCSMRGQL